MGKEWALCKKEKKIKSISYLNIYCRFYEQAYINSIDCYEHGKSAVKPIFYYQYNNNKKTLDEIYDIKTKKCTPIRPLTSFFLFKEDKKNERIYKGMSSKDIVKDLGKRWRELDNESKNEYKRRAYIEKKV